MLDIKKTHDALNGYFLNTYTFKLNLGYFDDYMEVCIYNNHDARERLKTCKHVYSWLWYELINQVNVLLDCEYYPARYTCNSYHLKKWFSNYGVDYKQALTYLINYFEEVKNNE